MLLLNIGVSTLLLLACLLPYISVALVPSMSIFSLFVPFLVLGNILFLIYWILQFKKTVFLPIASLVIAYFFSARLPLRHRVLPSPHHRNRGWRSRAPRQTTPGRHARRRHGAMGRVRPLWRPPIHLLSADATRSTTGTERHHAHATTPDRATAGRGHAARYHRRRASSPSHRDTPLRPDVQHRRGRHASSYPRVGLVDLTCRVDTELRGTGRRVFDTVGRSKRGSV